jgi:FtsP/CotA-like multicopper oxidase with cupredoxin domain
VTLAPFVEPIELLIEDRGDTARACLLTFGAAIYTGPTSSFTTRGYNGKIPGPTIRARAGDTLTITLKNALTDDENLDLGMNNIRFPNTTNLHVKFPQLSKFHSTSDCPHINNPS